MTEGSDCIFCRIAEGITPADVVLTTDETVFFRDISPKAQVHILGIPKRHIPSLASLTEEDEQVMGVLLRQVAQVAREAGLEEGGYRLISNVGSDAGQEVKHLHFHILGGERLGPMRC